jgi:hypothetical protein
MIKGFFLKKNIAIKFDLFFKTATDLKLFAHKSILNFDFQETIKSLYFSQNYKESPQRALNNIDKVQIFS